MDLEKSRQRINEIDTEIVKLFEKRMLVAADVAEYKEKNGLPIYNGQREREILSRLSAMTEPELSRYLRTVYGTIFDVSRAYQAKKMFGTSSLSEQIKNAVSDTQMCFPDSALVACQGKEGAYSQKACQRLFKSPSIMYFENFRGVFEAVKSGMCKYGILPVENSVYGSVTEVYDLMESFEFSIVKSVKLQVNHVLCANGGLEDIKEIVSHSQAIGQCSRFVSGLKGVKVKACENTAMAAEAAASCKGGSVGAICSTECAAVYGLRVIRENITDSDNNYTRFICISKAREIYPGADKMCFMISLPHTTGSLYSVISKLAAAGINLTKIESRPIPGRDFEFSFYFEMEVPGIADELYSVLSELEFLGEKFKFFGCYREI